MYVGKEKLLIYSLEHLLIDRKMKGPGWLDIKLPRKSTLLKVWFILAQNGFTFINTLLVIDRKQK